MPLKSAYLGFRTAKFPQFVALLVGDTFSRPKSAHKHSAKTAQDVLTVAPYSFHEIFVSVVLPVISNDAASILPTGRFPRPHPFN